MNIQVIAKDTLITTTGHFIFGTFIKYILKNKQDIKSWPYYTYIHAMINTGILLPFIFYLIVQDMNVNTFQQWLTVNWTSSTAVVGIEQWVQTINMGYCIASMLLSPKIYLNSPVLIIHHVVTFFGSLSVMHPMHCVGYATFFTVLTEGGSTMHNIMAMYNNTYTRCLRVFTDIITRGIGAYMIIISLQVAQKVLPRVLIFWGYVGGAIWFFMNAQWTLHVAKSLLFRRKRRQGNKDDKKKKN